MDNISQLLFLVSDSLLIPDIIVLLVLFVRALFLVGSFYNQYITKYKNERQLRPILNELSVWKRCRLHSLKRIIRCI